MLDKKLPGAAPTATGLKESNEGYTGHEISCNRELRIKKRKVVAPGRERS
jgi:hypothetical protein